MNFKNSKRMKTTIKTIASVFMIAILVPSMLGYVKKSKVSSANSAANSLQKAINTALIEIDEDATQDCGNITPIK